MRLVRWLPLLVACVVVGCGSGGGPSGSDDRLNLTTPKAKGTPAPSTDEPVTASEAAVIRGWADTLRQGHVDRAAAYFALPSVVANGTPLLRIATRAQAKQFNRALACGAKVVALRRGAQHRVIATFRLAERPGGYCDGGTGHLAHTAFRIRNGRITQWLRVDRPPGGGSGGATTPS
jgi:hypothetical protein